MQPQTAPAPDFGREAQVANRPNLHVVTGEGREADQAASPVFFSVIKVFFVLALLFCAVGFARVGLASATAATLNGNADLSEALEAGRDQSSNLEVMYAVFSSPTRVRDLATDTLGMVEAEDTVTLDMSDSASTQDSSAQDAAKAGAEPDTADAAATQAE